MPSSLAFFRNSSVEAPCKTISRILALIIMTSYNAMRPLYPPLPQTGQPFGPHTCVISSASCSENPERTNTSRGTSCGTFLICLHSEHNFRNSRCATMSRTEDATKNGSTPIFNNRLTVLGASFVCSVLNTRCPVKAALIPVSAVSKSRISPTRITSGSCRKNERSAAAKFSPISSCICT